MLWYNLVELTNFSRKRNWEFSEAKDLFYLPCTTHPCQKMHKEKLVNSSRLNPKPTGYIYDTTFNYP